MSSNRGLGGSWLLQGVYGLASSYTPAPNMVTGVEKKRRFVLFKILDMQNFKKWPVFKLSLGTP